MPTIGKTHLAALAMLVASSAGSQETRTRMPNPNAPPAPAGIPRNPRFPYEGVWEGKMTLPVGTDAVTIRFLVQDETYLSVLGHGAGTDEPARPAQATSGGLSWDQANSGGGRWLYKVQFASPDSLTGTMVLTNPPANLTPAPSGTLSLRRVPAKPTGSSREK